MFVPLKEKMYRKFTLDKVFNERSTNDQIYSEAILPFIQKFLSGFNSSIFVYGQTGSGKTHTMGILDSIKKNSSGIIPSSIRDIFHTMPKMNPKFEHSICVSMIQIYKDEVFDLLNPSSPQKTVREDTVYFSFIKENKNFLYTKSGYCSCKRAARSAGFS